MGPVEYHSHPFVDGKRLAKMTGKEVAISGQVCPFEQLKPAYFTLRLTDYRLVKVLTDNRLEKAKPGSHVEVCGLVIDELTI